MASSNIRSVSLITPRGTLRQFRMREDVNLLLNTKEMADLVRSVNHAASSFYKFSPKLGISTDRDRRPPAAIQKKVREQSLYEVIYIQFIVL